MLISEVIQNKAKVNQFGKKGIETCSDLLSFFPRKYYDFSRISSPSELHDNDTAVIYGVILGSETRESRSGLPMVQATVKAKPNDYYVNLIYFHQNYMIDRLAEGSFVTICGQVSVRMREVTMINPILTINATPTDPCLPGFYPVYSKISGMSDEYLKNTLNSLLDSSVNDSREYLPSEVVKKLGLISRKSAYQKIHQPNSKQDIIAAKRRLTFDDLTYYNVLLNEQSSSMQKEASWQFNVSQLAKEYVASLPYELTRDQKGALAQIIHNGQKSINKKSLVIGDVGYGKTEVAKITSLYAIEAGKQVAIMAPTLILATQHYNDFKESFASLTIPTQDSIGKSNTDSDANCNSRPIEVALLHSRLKVRERNALLKRLMAGEIDVLVSTQSLTNDEVKFKDLGMVIVDEEHRFGVNVRDKMALTYPDIYHISMTATPIPRTLALGLYGDDTEILTIKTAPSNRKPVKTIWGRYGSEFDIVKDAISKKHQVYVVCPSIEENDNTEMRSVDEVFKEYKNALPHARIGKLTGQMKSSEQELLLQRFNERGFDVLISTTVIEVGVNVPNSTVMVIQDADHFGLAQLHQLRGRVGRSNTIQEQAICCLLTSDKYDEVPERLKIMTESNDGFVIAEKDLEERGSGNWVSVEQSGNNRFVEMIMEYPKMNDVARSLAKKLTPESLEILTSLYE